MVLPLLNLPVNKVQTSRPTVHIMACCGASLLSSAVAILHVFDSQSRDTTDLGHVDTRTAIQRLSVEIFAQIPVLPGNRAVRCASERWRSIIDRLYVRPAEAITI